MNGQATPLRPNIGNYTQPISFVGLPVVGDVDPGGRVAGGQIIAAPWREDMALRIAAEERRGMVRAPRPPE
jgi:hypothetical protein